MVAPKKAGPWLYFCSEVGLRVPASMEIPGFSSWRIAKRCVCVYVCGVELNKANKID